MTAASSEVADKELKDKIATFYDQSSPLWEEIWGEHMHMGHYGKDGEETKTDQQAQIDMVRYIYCIHVCVYLCVRTCVCVCVHIYTYV